MILKIKILFCSFIIVSSSIAQEGVRPMNANINYVYKDLAGGTQLDVKNKEHISAKTLTASIQLPFIEDFYYGQYNAYPSQILWKDSSTYINTGYPIAPPSIGVATFDGLNKFGYPYTPYLTNLNSSLPADTLTSNTINLKTVGSQTLVPSDSVALSFFYQARGNGDNPEITDTLIVDFYDPTNLKWINNVWFQRGNTSPNTNDTIFKRAFLWVDSAKYLADGFKFRFRNKATTAGCFDHWHVDYINLDRFRSKLGDTTYNDLTFGYIPTPLLKNYAEMPWQQYTPSEMATTQSVKIRNNDGGTINMTYSSSVIAGTVTPAGIYNGGSTNMGAFKSSGWSNYSFHASPAFGYTISPLGDSAEVKVQHVVSRSSTGIDFNNNNDTAIQYQRFKNYYAYDDGTCEAGYYVLGQSGKMALKFSLNNLDTLRSLRIYFDPVGAIPTATTSYNFVIYLWANSGSGPGIILYADSTKLPKYSTKAYNAFADYTLTTKQILNPGTYYIGIKQKVANGITIGFDKNLDHHQSLYYDSGSGWAQSSIFGSLMMRPVFGGKIPAPVGISKFKIQDEELKIYPNPSNEIINVKLEISSAQSSITNYQLSIINTLGQVIQTTNNLNQTTQLSTINIPNGIYYLLLQSGNQTLQTQKIIIQH